MTIQIFPSRATTHGKRGSAGNLPVGGAACPVSSPGQAAEHGVVAALQAVMADDPQGNWIRYLVEESARVERQRAAQARTAAEFVPEEPLARAIIRPVIRKRPWWRRDWSGVVLAAAAALAAVVWVLSLLSPAWLAGLL